MIVLGQEQWLNIYDFGRRFFTVVGALALPGSFIVNSPFGRFTPRSSFLTVNGRLGWVLMEVWAPLGFVLGLLNSPLAIGSSPALTKPQMIVAGCFLTHYINRAFISPARTPSRSRMHLIMPLTGLILNTVNGGLLGTYLSSPFAHEYLQPERAFGSPTFYVGVFFWAIGFIGNVWADEILANIRRKANSKRADVVKKDVGKEYYGIPHGFLYRWISFPNYLCECIEMFGFALAASPVPNFAAMASPETVSRFAPTFTPPWIFLWAELCILIPRAYKGHQWYKQKFGDVYPKDRKAMIPYIF